MPDPLLPAGEYDIVGIGFGPSNLALAIALHEHNRATPPGQRLSFAFVEQQPEFGWHRGMLLAGATMQIAFLKDLVTLRNPASDFSFVSYLHQKDRLASFINYQSLYPSRREFHDYLEWAAGRVSGAVAYGRRVVDVRPVHRGADIGMLDVVAVDGSGGSVSYRARNVVLATGLTPAAPPEVELSDRVWHSDTLLYNIERIPVRPAPTFVVVGAGQSAAEAVEYLHGRYQDSQVHAVFTRYGYSPADESPFVNAIFDPAAVDTFFHADASVKEMLLAYHRNTNYSVVDRELIHELYRRHYQESVVSEVRLHLAHMSRVVDASTRDDGVDVTVRFLPTGQIQRIDADAVVYATGYRPVDPLEVLGAAASWCKRDSEDRLRVDLDYRVDTTDSMTCGIFVLGATEAVHGLSSSLLSNAAVRAGQVVQAVTREAANHGTEGRR